MGAPADVLIPIGLPTSVDYLLPLLYPVNDCCYWKCHYGWKMPKIYTCLIWNCQYGHAQSNVTAFDTCGPCPLKQCLNYMPFFWTGVANTTQFVLFKVGLCWITYEVDYMNQNLTITKEHKNILKCP